MTRRSEQSVLRATYEKKPFQIIFSIKNGNKKMSFVLSYKAAKIRAGGSADKAVLRCLCDYADDDGTNCRPSTTTICAETELNRKTVFKSVANLVAQNLISVNALNGRHNFYLINVERIEELFNLQSSTKNGTAFGTTSTKNGTALPETSAKNGTSPKFGQQPVPKTVLYSVNTQSINNNIDIVDTTPPNFELTADDAEQKKSAVKKTRPITHSFDLKEIPEEWKTLCAKMRPDLEPFAAFAEFQFYWQEGAGASTKRSDNGWRTTWLNYLKSPRTRPTPRPTPRPQTFNRAHCLAEPAGGYTTEFYESQMSWEEMNEKRRNGEL